MAGAKEQAYFEAAERLFVQEGKTAAQIAALLPVSENTVYKWSLKGGWPQKRAAALNSPKNLGEMLRQNLERQVEILNGEERLNPATYDAIYKSICAIQKVERAQDLRVIAIAVGEGFFGYLKGQDLPAGELQLIGGRFREWLRSLE
jgi:transposase